MRSLFLFLSLLLAAASFLPGGGGVLALPPTFSPTAWKPTSIVRTVELGGSVTHTNTAYTAKRGHSDADAAGSDAERYIVALDRDEADKLSWIQAKERGSGRVLAVKDEGRDEASGSHLFSVAVPPKSGDTFAFNIATVSNHVVRPLPETVSQSDQQFLLWEGDAGVRSVYGGENGRVKVRSSSANIVSHSPTLHATKSGSTITFGPFSPLPALKIGATPSKPKSGEAYTPEGVPVKGRIHYEHEVPVVTITELDRHIEVSHWGDNLAVRDVYNLTNSGPRLKGHFSRIAYQQAAFYRKANSPTLNDLTLHLPPGVRDPYYVDQVGNVTTSSFRPSSVRAASPGSGPGAGAPTLLDLRPRYPILGGWNYNFTVGYDLPASAGGWLRKDVEAGSNKFVIAVPFLTPITDVALDDVTTRIVLPEGATDVSVHLPFEVDSMKEEVYTTYLDTIGRPSVVLKRRNCSERHGGLIYIGYAYSTADHLRKPVAVASVAAGIFVIFFLLRRFDTKIKTE